MSDGPTGTAAVAAAEAVPPLSEARPDGGLERRGRRWLLWSFLACPCHLPWTLALLGSVLGGTVLGTLVREHTVVAGTIVAGTWLAGTARGFQLVRRAQRGELACRVRLPGN